MGVSINSLKAIEVAISFLGVSTNRGLKMCEMGCMEMHEGFSEHETAKDFFESRGVNHVSIDLNGMHGSKKIDLRKPIDFWDGYFDIITDIGTGEHVTNQYMYFKNCHTICRVGGVIVHRLPAEGHYFKRKIYHYDKKFFKDLAEIGGYEILHLEMTPLATCILRKVKNKKFSKKYWEENGMEREIYNDNRLLKVTVGEKHKYKPHMESTVKEFMRRFPAPLKVVDIGTRDGYAVELLDKAGYDVIGTELIAGFVAHAKLMGRNVKFDNIMETDLPKDAFDVIYSRHCIEHCPDPYLFLKNCEQILKPGGHIFITFPLETKNEFYARKNPGKNHMVYFKDKNSFRRVVKKTNFVEMEFCKSKRYNIHPDRREVLFMGKMHV